MGPGLSKIEWGASITSDPSHQSDIGGNESAWAETGVAGEPLAGPLRGNPHLRTPRGEAESAGSGCPGLRLKTLALRDSLMHRAACDRAGRRREHAV